MSYLLAFATTFLAVGVFYASFCRIDRMPEGTRASIRFGYSCLGAAAAALALSPWVPDWHFSPHPLVVALLAAQLSTLVAMRRNWLFGVPGTAVGR